MNGLLKKEDYLLEHQRRQQAFIQDSNLNAGFKVQSWTLDLTTARTEEAPFIIGFPFKSIAFEGATVNTANVFCKYNSNDSGVSRILYKDNAVVSTDTIFSKAFISHAAQPGVSIRITVYLDADYESGSLINSGTVAISGFVSPSIGSGFTDAVQTLVAATTTLVFAADPTRPKGVVINNTGASLFMGDSSTTNTGANLGEEVLNGDRFDWDSTAALYTYSVAGGDIYKRSHTT